MRAQLIAWTHLVDAPDDYVWCEDAASDADELAEVAGRLCYKSWGRPNPATATNPGYIANIITQAHFSVLEHASASFWLTGISRSLTHELVRHRHLSFSQVSQRYVDESAGEMVLHPALTEENGVNPEVIRNIMMKGRAEYEIIVRLLEQHGVDRKTARGAARGVLPNATATEMVVTGNHRCWREVLLKRLPGGADAEIRVLAAELLRQLYTIAPATYNDIMLDYQDGEFDAPWGRTQAGSTTTVPEAYERYGKHAVRAANPERTTVGSVVVRRNEEGDTAAGGDDDAPTG